jgi:hypothetical protein
MGVSRYSEEFRSAAVALVLEKGRTPNSFSEEKKQSQTMRCTRTFQIVVKSPKSPC